MDAGFPSGKWTGYYTYASRRPHRMDLFLTFQDALVAGDGVDDIGRFLIRGDYSTESRRCSWAKQYVGAHTVSYQGVQQGQVIVGEWTLAGHRGGFRIWPSEHGDLTEEFFVEETSKETPWELTGTRSAPTVSSRTSAPATWGRCTWPNP